MAREISFGARPISRNNPCFLIAEAGVNHNGDLDAVEQLVVEAKRAGADCVKFQTFAADRLASVHAPKAAYQLRTTDPAQSQLHMLRELELSAEGHKRALATAARERIEFLSTPYSVEDVDYLESLGVDAYKIASALIVEPKLLRRVAATGKPVILSTGLATMAEVGDAVATFRAEGNDRLVVLQCTTNYPADVAEANLRAMQTMSSAFDVLAGYSDHTTTATAAIAAVALGAVVVEKHFTLDKRLAGPDQATSADPAEFAAFVAAIREAEASLGDGVKEPSESERTNIHAMRRGLAALVEIPAGTTLEATMVVPKRPATGIMARDLDTIIGRVTLFKIEADQPLEWSMFEATE